MAYYLRTDNGGILVGKLDNRAAGMMINQLKGRWVEKNFKSGKRSVYLFTEAASFGNDVMKFQVWENFYIGEE